MDELEDLVYGSMDLQQNIVLPNNVMAHLPEIATKGPV